MVGVGAVVGEAGRAAAEDEDGLGWSEPASPAAGAPGEPLLGRAEMAALLRGGRGDPRPGVLAMVGAGGATYERWPMLEVVLDRFRERLQASLRELSSGEVDLSLEGIGARRLGEHLESLPRPTPIAVVRAVEWGGHALLILDRALAFALVDLLLGGRRAAAPAAGQTRALTGIERALIERFAGLLLADLGRAFEPVVPVRFTLERIETDPRFATVTRSGNVCVLMSLRIAFDGRGGMLALLVPYATLEPARDVLQQMFTGEKLGRDPIWERHLASRIWAAGVELEAVLDERTTTLREVLDLRVGSVLRLAVRPDSPVVLRCGGVPILTGRLGRVGDRVSVRIEDRIGGEGDG